MHKVVGPGAQAWPRWVPRRLGPRHLKAARLLALGMRPGEVALAVAYHLLALAAVPGLR